jgi:dienelactone hydrolase
MAVDFRPESQRNNCTAPIPPVLVGYSSGATLVYATLAQAPPGTFAGAMSLGFCADQDFRGATLCRGAGLKYSPNKRGDYVFEPAPHLRDPWITLQGQQDAVCSAPAVDSFAAQVAHAQVVRLPAVGHGFSVQRNWVPQFNAAYAELSARKLPEVPAPGGGSRWWRCRHPARPASSHSRVFVLL